MKTDDVPAILDGLYIRFANEFIVELANAGNSVARLKIMSSKTIKELLELKMETSALLGNTMMSPERIEFFSIIYNECLATICNRGQNAVEKIFGGFCSDYYDLKLAQEKTSFSGERDECFMVKFNAMSKKDSEPLGKVVLKSKVMADYDRLSKLSPLLKILILEEGDTVVIAASMWANQISDLEKAK